MSSSAPQTVSFTVRRPSPESRGISPGSDAGSSFKVPALPRHLSGNDGTSLGSPLARSTTSSPRPVEQTRHDDHDSSDEDNEIQDELVTGFDKFGVQRVHEKKEKSGPLIIPSLKNKDWRELARKRRNQGRYIPDSAQAKIGADGSVGGLGTRDTINSGPVLSGLQVKKRSERSEIDNGDGDVPMDEVDEAVKVEETEEQRALRALLAEANGEVQDENSHYFIPTPVSETDALKQDVQELPEAATLQDYERVPISQFGAAMLRGMGWKEGQAASRKGKGMVEPYIPSARPALLGIGAKEQEVYDDGSKPKYKDKRPERRYVPVIRQEKEGLESRDTRDRSRSPKTSSGRSRHGSPDRRERSKHDRGDFSRRTRDREDDYSRSREKDRDRDSRKEGDRDRRRRDYERDDRRDAGRRRDYY